jgi:regulator of sigma E protease
MDTLIKIASFIFALGILITFHEFGHYLVARLAGVKVLRFSLGFGRALYVKRAGRDQTEWAIAAIPLGGYVKMLDEREGEVAAHELNRAFNRQSVGKRFAIVVAGPVANFLLAVVLYWALFVSGVQGMKPVVAVPAPNTPAAFAGFRDGELIRSIEGQDIATWQDVRWALLRLGLEHARVAMETQEPQGGIAFRTLDMSGITPSDLEGNLLEKLGLAPFRPKLAPVIDKVTDSGAARAAGMMSGDEIVSVDDRAISSWQNFVDLVRASPGKPLKMSIRRGGQLREITVTPQAELEANSSVGKIGAAPRIDEKETAKLFTIQRYGPGTALVKAAEKTWDTSIFSLKMLGEMLVGKVSWKNLSGPITIADYAGQSAQLGLTSYLAFLALISISLGVLNLLPIPLLDGGHLMYYVAEVVKGSPVSERAMEIGSRIGFALLIGLMAFAFYNDINRLLTS